MSNYPPGVTGSEPHLTGEWPCYECGGAGGDFDEDGGHSCWMCGGSGVHPEDPPDCPKCGAVGTTDWIASLDEKSQRLVLAKAEDDGPSVKEYDWWNVVYCHECGEVPR